MRVDHQGKQEQAKKRLELKTAEAAFQNQIVNGTNCSNFESIIITSKAKEIFRLGQYEEHGLLQDGQMVFQALDAEEPPGKKIEECQTVRCVLTHILRQEDNETKDTHGLSAKRRQQIIRMAVEAKEQGALLTQEDLGLILDCDTKTIRNDIKVLKEQGVTVPTRGTVRDIGPGLTHKQQAIRLWIEGKEPLHVARHLNHSLRAVERYIQTFARVVYAQRQFRDIFKTALVVGISMSAANAYWETHCKLAEQGDAGYTARMEEIERIGLLHWETADEKKSPSPRPKRTRRGSRK